jgi:hypothetical protein
VNVRSLVLGLLMAINWVTPNGAKGDGIADDTAPLQRALDQAAAMGATLRLPCGTFRITAPLTLLTPISNLTIVGEGAATVIDATDLADTEIALKIQGTAVTRFATVATDITRGTRIIAGLSTTTGLVAGGMVQIQTDQVFNDDRPLQYTRGELGIIESVDSPSQITLTSALYDNYTALGYDLRIDAITPSTNLTFSDFTIRMRAGATTDTRGLQLRYFQTARMTNVNFDGCANFGVKFWDGIDAQVQGGWFTDSNDDFIGYGVWFFTVQDAQLIGARGLRCRHLVDVGGAVSRNVLVQGCIARNSAYSGGISSHGGTEYVSFIGNQVYDCVIGYNIRGRAHTVIGNLAVRCSEQGYFIGETGGTRTGQAGRQLTFTDNKAEYCGWEGFYCPVDMENATIRGNTFKGCGSAGKDSMLINGTTIRKSLIAQNIITDPDAASTNGIYIYGYGATDGANQKGLTIEGNQIYDVPQTGLLFTGNSATTAANLSEGIIVATNIIQRSGVHAIQLTGYFGTFTLGPNTTDPTTGTQLDWANDVFQSNPIITGNFSGFNNVSSGLTDASGELAVSFKGIPNAPLILGSVDAGQYFVDVKSRTTSAGVHIGAVLRATDAAGATAPINTRIRYSVQPR